MGEFYIPSTIIHLLGAPGTGKYTIAKEITRMSKNFVLVDNHLINNPLFSIIRRDGKTKLPPRIWDNVKTIWGAVADTMIHISPPDFNFVLTNALFEGDADDRRHMKNMRNVAKKRKGEYIPVRLLITDEKEHARRITSRARKERMKETDAAAVKRYAGREVLKTGLIEELTLDVTRLKPKQAAAEILNHAGGVWR